MREIMTRRMAIAVLALALLTPVSASRSLAEEKDKLVGTCKLISAVSEDLATGQKTNIYKGTPVGFIAYGADGRVMTIIVDSDRKKPTGTVTTAPEAKALFRSMVAYAGTYAIKDSQVIHRPDASWNETWTGTDQIRDYKFDGDRLMLATAPSPDPFTGKMSVRTLVWEKVK
jgi:Lipocalin-like domain